MTGRKTRSTATGAAATPAAPSTAETAFREMIRVFGLIRQVMEPYFNRHGISASQWGVLRVLHRAQADSPDGLRLTDLGQRLLVRPPSVTGAVDRLQRMGLVARTASTTDLRSKRVSLTPKGLQLVQRVLVRLGDQIARVMGGLTAPQHDDLLGLMGQMASHLEEMAKHEEAAAESGGTLES